MQENKTLEALLDECRSFRRFSQVDIPREHIEKIVEMAARRSCGKNSQVLRFVAITGRENILAISPYMKWAGSLPPELGTPKENELPTAVIAIYYPGEANMLRDLDTGIAADTIAIAAADMGYGSCMLASINSVGFKKFLDVDEDTTMRLVVALGKPSHKSTIVEGNEDNLLYYVDENRDYYVPKLAVKDVLRFK